MIIIGPFFQSKNQSLKACNLIFFCSFRRKNSGIVAKRCLRVREIRGRNEIKKYGKVVHVAAGEEDLRRRCGGLIRKIYSVAEPLSRFVEWIRGACPPGF